MRLLLIALLLAGCAEKTEPEKETPSQSLVTDVMHVSELKRDVDAQRKESLINADQARKLTALTDLAEEVTQASRAAFLNGDVARSVQLRGISKEIKEEVRALMRAYDADRKVEQALLERSRPKPKGAKP